METAFRELLISRVAVVRRIVLVVSAGLMEIGGSTLLFVNVLSDSSESDLGGTRVLVFAPIDVLETGS